MSACVRVMIAGARTPSLMADPTVSAGYTKALLAYAVARGGDSGALLERAGLSPADLDHQDNRIPLAACAALIQAAVAASGDPAFALKFGEALKMENMSIALLVAGMAGTVEDGRRQLNRFGRLVLDDDRRGASELLQLVRDRKGLWLQFSPAPGDATRYFAEAGFAWCVRETRAMLQAQADQRPFLKAVHFTHAEPRDRAEYDRVFGVPLVFGSDRNAMLIDSAFLGVRLPAANPYVAEVLEDRAKALLDRLDSGQTMRGRVQRLLAPLLPKGEGDMQTVAQRMGLSRQTLFRKLATENTTFERLRDELRRDLAIHHLGENASVAETAYRVGFSDPAAFSRAFKRWTGQSPSRIGRSS